ncbi:MAG TPA: response regulator, partial [Terrimesophilobacter sp.]|nr:response regulator [Terrimesophilobacter sp.]
EFEADDLRIYLEHAGARGRIVPDRDSAAHQCAGFEPPVVVVRAGALRRPGESPAKPEAVRQVVITRGRRRRARIIGADIVGLDGDALRCGALLRAVAVAAGRASPEVVHEDAQTPLPGEIPPPTVGEAREAGRLILVVEDDAINQKVILQQLALLGHAAELAGDGAEALKMWRSGHHALILTDLHMPRMDGYALSEAIRREERTRGGPRVPILALTANALRGEAHRTLAAGIDEHLTKPIQLSLLREALERWLPTQRSNLEEPASVPPVRRDDEHRPVDPDVLRELVGNDEAVMRELLGDYLAVLDTQGEALRQAIAAPEMQEVGRIAHKLKSSSRAIGATGLGNLCAELEVTSKRGDGQAVTDALARFVETVARVRSGISALLSEQPVKHRGPL